MSGPDSVIMKPRVLQNSPSERGSIQSFAPAGIHQGRSFKVLDKIDGLIILAVYNIGVALFVWLSMEKNSNRAEFGFDIGVHLSQAFFLFTAIALAKENPKLVKVIAKALIIVNLVRMFAIVCYNVKHISTVPGPANFVDFFGNHPANIAGLFNLLKRLASQEQKKIA